MGLLDELEKEAARLQKDGDDDAAQRERLAAWEERLKPAVERFGEYLTRLASTLTAARRRIRLVYPIAGYGDAGAFGEAPFECRVTPATTQVEFEFTFAAQVSPEESTLVVAETPGKVRLVNGLLQNHRLSGLHDVTKNANGDVVSGRFQARGRVPVRVHGIATLDSAQLKLTITNVEAFGTLQRSFTAEALTEETFDALGRYLLRENPQFGRDKVGADVRRQLQSQVQRDQIRREWEAKLAVQLQEDEKEVVSLMAASASPAAFVRRVGGAVSRLFQRGGR